MCLPLGSTKTSGLPRDIATFLELQEPDQYTGHCFKRTSATFLADSGTDLTALKRHGGEVQYRGIVGGTMCILFLYSGANERDSDYSLILASNRDEFLDRPALRMKPWREDPTVVGGRDQQAGSGEGAWLAISPLRKKIGVLLNLSGSKKENAKSRGRIVGDYVRDDASVKDYTTAMKDYSKECNDFNFVAIELNGTTPTVYNYSNATDYVDQWTDLSSGLGISNSLPDVPLQKAETGKRLMRSICTKYNKADQKAQLVEELIKLLKSTEKHLPDAELVRRQPIQFRELSSIFVNIPQERYGTRTHTLVIVTKSGHMDIIELTLDSPIITPNTDTWVKSEYQFDLFNSN